MPKKRLLWQLYLTYLFITFIALLSIGWYALNSIEKFYYDRTATDLEVRAHLVERLVAKNFTLENAFSLDAISKELGTSASMRVTLIHPSGQVLGDSHEDPARMDNHATRPEIREALSGKKGTSIRFSRTLQQKLMYLAIPVFKQDQVIGVVRTSIPITFIDSALRSIEIKVGLGGGVVALFAAGISLLVSRRITRPLEVMRRAAEAFARGDLTGKVPVANSLEMGGLAEALNQMAKQLDDRIRSITEERNEREAVLFSMVEGVFAVDAAGRFISMNQAAADLIGVDPEKCQGRNIQEMVRNNDLQQFVEKALSSHRVVETDIILRGAENLNLQARGTVLKDANDNSIGALIVLNDVTRLRRLENVRRDFVANVSHELKTPVTSIKGFVETLLGGALDHPQDAWRFLEIVSRQVDRLNAIIEDLLSLSRLEQDPDSFVLQLEEVQLKDLLQSAVQACENQVAKQNATVKLVCEEGLQVRINPALLEQAVVNLVDNAIKYSGPKKEVEVVGEEKGGGIIIRVQDWGNGIGKEHLPRLFERFYRVDQARSRELGGTGLGLAIVKHIVQVHKGFVEVDSTLGKGSVFSIHLPKKQNNP